MAFKFSTEIAPDAEYEQWKANWQPPARPLKAIFGFAIVEFSPYGNRGAIFTPEEASNNAMVVSDGNEGQPTREGFLPQGTEVIYVGTAGSSFTLGDRTFMRVPRAEIEMYVPKEVVA
jgi:hypothetical protein